MDLSLDLKLLERMDDRVRCEVTLSPEGSSPIVDGVALQLVDADDRPLGARALLPVSGRVAQRVSLEVELRADEPLAADASLVVVAWSGRDGIRVRVPARPPPSLESHVRGAQAPQGVDLSPVLAPEPELRDRLERSFPWVATPLRRPDVAGVLEGREPTPSEEELAERFDLGEDTAAWLRDLLDEEEER